MHFTFCNNNNYPPARITAREATEQKLLEWPYPCMVLAIQNGVNFLVPSVTFVACVTMIITAVVFPLLYCRLLHNHATQSL